MNSFSKIYSLAILAIGLVACQLNAVNPSYRIVDKNVTSGDFTSISLGLKGKVVYSQGSTTTARVSGSDNVVDLVQFQNVGGKLTIKFQDGVNVRIDDDDDLMIYISSPNINALTVTGAGSIDVSGALNVSSLDLKVTGRGDIETKGIRASGDITATVTGSGDISMDANNQANSITMTTSGSGDVDCDNPTARTITATVSGTGDIDIEGGLTSTATLTTTGTGKIEAHRLEAGVVNATVTGRGDITCYAVDTLKSNISGRGSVRYLGSPKIVSSGNYQPEVYRRGYDD